MQTAGMSYAWYRDAFCQLERKIAHEEQKDFYMLLEQDYILLLPIQNATYPPLK